jgi:thioesterase domain-containing protein
MLSLRNKNQRAAANTALSLASDLLTRYGPQMASSAGRYARNYLDSGRGASSIQPSYSGNPVVMVRPKGPKRRKAKKKNRRRKARISASDTQMLATPRNDRIRVILKDSFQAVNNSANQAQLYYQLANVYTATHDFQTWLPRATTLSVAFANFKIHKFHMVFQPTLAYSSTGVLCMGVDPNPANGNAPSVSAIIKHIPSTLGDIKDRHELIWTPGDDQEDLDHYTNLGSVTAPASISQGTVQIFSTNSEANNAILGYFIVEVDIEFFGLQ